MLSQQKQDAESCFGQKMSGKTCCQTSLFLLRMSDNANKWRERRNQPQQRYQCPISTRLGRNKGDSEPHSSFCLALGSVPPCLASHSAWSAKYQYFIDCNSRCIHFIPMMIIISLIFSSANDAETLDRQIAFFCTASVMKRLQAKLFPKWYL